MTNEIKEILEKLKDGNWYDELDLTGTMWIELRWEETHLLLDYITNLQEEIERQEKSQVILDNQNAELQERIDKALEYMKSEYTVTDDEVYLFLTNRVASLSKLENILKGDDNESNN